MTQSSYPSIQSFFKAEVRKPGEKQPLIPSKPAANGDGFTETELEEALDPLSKPWNPEREYDETTIDQLKPGPNAVTFIGRIAYFNTVWGRSSKQPKAAGWHYVIVKDNTGAISLKLYFGRKEYPFKLGQLVSIWTAFISNMSKSESRARTMASANLFPGRNTSDHIMIHTRDIKDNRCKVPLDYERNQPPSGLMTLESYIGGGHEVPGAKILVCVKSIGAKRKITIKKTSAERDVCEVMLFDHTGEVKLSLWGEMYISAREWQPSCTVLLITSPSFKLEYDGKGAITLVPSTMVDVDPDIADREWLRKYAVRRTKRESVCVKFPEDVWDVDEAVFGIYRSLFTLAEVDEWVRNNPSQTFTGWINVIILELSLVSFHRKNMMMCADCCGIPIYNNNPSIQCSHCDHDLTLNVNPRILGSLIDETGCIASDKLIWSPKAWEELLGRNAHEMAALSGEEIRWLEQRLAGLRCHLCFGWSGAEDGESTGGRLAVLGMRA